MNVFFSRLRRDVRPGLRGHGDMRVRRGAGDLQRKATTKNYVWEILRSDFRILSRPTLEGP